MQVTRFNRVSIRTEQRAAAEYAEHVAWKHYEPSSGSGWGGVEEFFDDGANVQLAGQTFDTSGFAINSVRPMHVALD